MGTFYRITMDEMTDLMKLLGFQQIVVDNTYEAVFAREVHSKPGLEIRVYSSIDRRGEARDVGSDAIRVVIFATIYNRGVGSEARVYRTTGWNKNLQSRVGAAMAHALGGNVPRCKCGAWMVKREGKHGAFLGCVSYPACRETRGIEKERMAS